MESKGGFKKFLKIVSYVKPHKMLFIFVFLLSLVSAAVGLVNPYLQKILFDDILLGSNFKMLWVLATVFLGVYLFSNVFGSFRSYISQILNQKILFDIKTKMFNHLLNLNLNFLKNKKIGDLMNRISGDSSSIKGYIDSIFSNSVLDIFRLIGIVAVSLSLSWKVTLFALAFFPLYFFAYEAYTKKIVNASKELREKGSDANSFLQERLSSLKALKDFNREQRESLSYGTYEHEVNKLKLKNSILNMKSSLISGFVIYLPSFIVLFAGGYMIMKGTLTIGALIALRAYIQQLFDPVGSLTRLRRTLKTEMVGIDRVFEILDAKSNITEYKNAVELNYVRGAINFKNVSFDYDDKTPVLRGINLSISPGEKIGIVGPSGSGKSTITNLLMRYYDPTSGMIGIDGYDLKTLKINSLRKNIGIVSQESIMFNTTIRDNIRFGTPNAKDDDVIKAAKLAKIHDFILTMPQGYDTNVGERGLILSGGQKQRISIARVILKNPKILILDEATSSLDTESERKIQEALDYITKGRTSIVIAHRLSTIENADRIIVLDNKRIAEEGDFASLMKQKGVFSHLYKQQFGGYKNFEQKFDQEVERSNKFGGHLTMAVLDLKNFEHLVQLEGRESAEKISDKVEMVLEKNLRNTDFFTKDPHASNVFIVMMPETTKKDADDIVNKLIEKIKNELAIDMNINHNLQTSDLKKVIKEII